MPREYTHPTIEEGAGSDRKQSHPSYAKINVSRVSGRTELFQSAVTHQHYITLSIQRAYVMGEQGHELVMGDGEMIEVAMSETQFAQMVTSLNIGSGSPCTLQRLQGKSVEQPINEDQQQSHRDMVQGKLKGVMNAQLEVAAQITAWREAKHRPTLKELDRLAERVASVSGNFESNMGYYASLFEEHMEAVVGEAKTEVETHMLQTAGRLGITDEHLPGLELDDSKHPRIA